jgi:hypothetical protein
MQTLVKEIRVRGTSILARIYIYGNVLRMSLHYTFSGHSRIYYGKNEYEQNSLDKCIKDLQYIVSKLEDVNVNVGKIKSKNEFICDFFMCRFA